jgi:hypothetical protein
MERKLAEHLADSKVVNEASRKVAKLVVWMVALSVF